MTITAEEFHATVAEHGLTPLDIADALHRQQLADPDFDPIEEARDQIRGACSKLLNAVAYLSGTKRQILADSLVTSGKTELIGDERLFNLVDVLVNWLEDTYEQTTGKELP